MAATAAWNAAAAQRAQERTERDTHFDTETTNGLGVHVVAHVLQRTPRHLRTPTSSNASKIRPGPGIPPGYIVPVAKRSFHVFRRDPRSADHEGIHLEKFNLPW